MPRVRFVRADTTRLSRLGKNRRKLQKWRRPRGTHNKLRKKRTSYPDTPSIGYGREKTMEGRIQGLLPVLVHNVSEMQKLTQKNIAIIARVGAKNKLEIIKKADEIKVKIANIGRKK